MNDDTRLPPANDPPATHPTALHPPGADSEIPDDPRVIEVVQDYLRELEAGRFPDPRAYAQRYPELAVPVAHCLAGLEMLHAGAPRRKDAAPPALPTAPGSAPEGRLASPLGDFQIVRELARGGMGVVYEAVQLSLGRRVALKVLPFAATFDARQLQRFKNEAQAAALLHHTHIVPIYAVGCERGVHFYAMQLIEGQSLAVVIQQLRARGGRAAPIGAGVEPRGLDSTTAAFLSEPFPAPPPAIADPAGSTVDVSASLTAGAPHPQGEAFVRRAARLLVQAALALEHAHQEGVVHRDIKPGNLLLDVQGNLWITDFGLALFQADHGLTRSGDVLGTFRYMSPEQTNGQRAMLDHRTDIYSLGATFYELLALEPVFAGETHQELLYQILHVEPRPPREHNRAIPGELETILLKTLSKNPVDRYRTAGELAADVQRYLDHQPILARRPSLVDRARKWSRRHPSAVIAAMVLLAAITALSLASQWRIAIEQQRTADALAREQLRASEAEERFQQAREAVDSLLQISEEELTDRPYDGARQRILELVLGYYQDFIEQRQGDPAAQAELARTQDKVKRILHQLSVVQREMQTGLLELSSVTRELELTPEQQARLRGLLDDWSEERAALREMYRSLTEDQRRDHFVALAERHEQALAELFTGAQLRRFRQIGRQSQGLSAFKDPDVVRALRLTPEQRARIRDLERELAFASFRGPPPGPPGGFGDPRRRNAGERGPGERGPGPGDHFRASFSHHESVARVLELLTDPQRAAWEDLAGPPFTGFTFPGFPARPGGPP